MSGKIQALKKEREIGKAIEEERKQIKEETKLRFCLVFLLDFGIFSMAMTLILTPTMLIKGNYRK